MDPEGYKPMRYISLVSLVLIVGCGGDPRTSRLAHGDRVEVAGDAPDRDWAGVSKYDSRTGYEGTRIVPEGQQAVVVADRQSPGDDTQWLRGVAVRFEGGEHDGHVAEIARNHLRPR